MKKLKLFAITLISLLFFNCKTNVDVMLDDYNQNFKTPSTEEVEALGTQPGDPTFDESEMLKPEYYVYEDATFCLSGPRNATSYKWDVVDMEDKDRTPINVTTKTGSSLSSKDFIIVVPDSGLVTGKTYKITLTVESGGKAYRDSCGLIIYKHYTY